ncbi:MAG: plasmid stabilization protein [Ignavibacteria bacterium GWB2_35_12]|nr:MAG: plasmid stabilization protein [Ignavibacteria bacterium GWA2_35_8]OGU38823.1 MAG: plasmid stabilization protein [Ignavibacteria bacterium GWB2_35_12]OGU92297.1 MAG: plasmid stabilization protein [Ignavibacteria bacterium RIFOXYA2_FULL_35_10]OGV20311.1 MAG: plasmid stabilization protein [Ignavibacteria bacterium RIFOXYC2_FULL_35_21]
MEVSFSSSFLRAYKKSIKDKPELEKIFLEKLQLFIENPFNPQLKTHKLSGKLENMWSFTITYKIRVTFTFIKSDLVLFENFGTHYSVY